MTNTPKSDEYLQLFRTYGEFGEVELARNDSTGTFHNISDRNEILRLNDTINQQAEEIAKARDAFQKELAKKIDLEIEIEKLKGKGITTLNDYREEVKMRLEAQTERDNDFQKIEKLKAELSVRVDYANECRDLGYQLQTVSENNKHLWKNNDKLTAELKDLRTRFDGLLKKLEDSIDKEIDDPIGDEKHLLIRYVDIQSIIKQARGE